MKASKNLLAPTRRHANKRTNERMKRDDNNERINKQTNKKSHPYKPFNTHIQTLTQNCKINIHAVCTKNGRSEMHVENSPYSSAFLRTIRVECGIKATSNQTQKAFVCVRFYFVSFSVVPSNVCV